MSRLYQALRDAADGAFVIDANMRIIFWNKAAEEILGFTRKEAEGQYCYQILHGIDENRELVCKDQCEVVKLMPTSKGVPNYDVEVKTKHGDSRWLNISVFSYMVDNSNKEEVIVHLFHVVKQKKLDEKFIKHLVEAARKFREYPEKSKDTNGSRLDELTKRESEVLTLLVNGYGTSEISENLFISPYTVRNHIQRILEKLRVHSRIEIVAYAINNGFEGNDQAINR